MLMAWSLHKTGVLGNNPDDLMALHPMNDHTAWRVARPVLRLSEAVTLCVLDELGREAAQRPDVQ
jgi:hypothetical protein